MAHPILRLVCNQLCSFSVPACSLRVPIPHEGDSLVCTRRSCPLSHSHYVPRLPVCAEQRAAGEPRGGDSRPGGGVPRRRVQAGGSSGQAGGAGAASAGGRGSGSTPGGAHRGGGGAHGGGAAGNGGRSPPDRCQEQAHSPRPPGTVRGLVGQSRGSGGGPGRGGSLAGGAGEGRGRETGAGGF